MVLLDQVVQVLVRPVHDLPPEDPADGLPVCGVMVGGDAQRLATGDVDELTQLKTSLMPADLQKNLTVDELVDLVEYLTTLKKR